MKETTKDVLKSIKGNLKQASASKKDEINVMRTMLNDKDFQVDIYTKEGKTGTYNPSDDMRAMCSNIIASTTKIGSKEAQDLMDKYEFSKTDATAMVSLSKEFINVYLQSGRKLPLGGRENSDVALEWKTIKDRTTGVPGRNGEERKTVFIPQHDGIKVYNPCPVWLKK